MSSFFEQFRNQMKEKGLNLEDKNVSNQKSDLLSALENHLDKQQHEPITHTHHDHASFTRHGSNSAAVEDKKDDNASSLQKDSSATSCL